MKTEIILASVLIVFLVITVVSIQPAFAVSPDFIQFKQERQSDYYNISIKVFNSPGYGFWDHGDYVSGASIIVHAMDHTISGKTNQFGYFEGGFYVPRDQAPGAYDVTASINGQEFKVGQTFVLKFVAQQGPGGSDTSAPESPIGSIALMISLLAVVGVVGFRVRSKVA